VAAHKEVARRIGERQGADCIGERLAAAGLGKQPVVTCSRNQRKAQGPEAH
jgi:hypothetical protein